jgi:hypothetical protein
MMPHDIDDGPAQKFRDMSPEELRAAGIKAGMVPHPETKELLHPMDVKVNYPELAKPSAAEQGPTSSPDQTAIDVNKSFYRRGDALLKSIRVCLWRQGY